MGGGSGRWRQWKIKDVNGTEGRGQRRKRKGIKAEQDVSLSGLFHVWEVVLKTAFCKLHFRSLKTGFEKNCNAVCVCTGSLWPI